MLFLILVYFAFFKHTAKQQEFLPGHNCCRKVYIATSSEAELERPPPSGTLLAITALKPGMGCAV